MNGILDRPFEGVHCETTAFINLALSTGTSLTEPMAFGLGCGLSFIYRHSKRMLQPFVGGRVKPDWIMRNASATLGLELIEEQMTSPRKAESELLRNLDRGRLVGLKLDRFYLDYTHDEYHFPAHHVARSYSCGRPRTRCRHAGAACIPGIRCHELLSEGSTMKAGTCRGKREPNRLGLRPDSGYRTLRARYTGNRRRGDACVYPRLHHSWSSSPFQGHEMPAYRSGLTLDGISECVTM